MRTKETSADNEVPANLCDLIKDNYIINSSVLIKTEIMKKIKFDESKDKFAVEDYDLWLKLKSLKYNFFYLKEPLVGYRIHQNQISNKALRNTILLYLNIFMKGLPGKITMSERFLALYKAIRLVAYSIKNKIMK